MKKHYNQLEQLYRQIAMMAQAGLPLPLTLRELAGNVRQRRFRQTLDAMAASTEQGASLADAMRRHPDWFDELAVSLVEQGETHGTLPELLHTAADVAALDAELVQGLRLRMFYPLITIALAISILGFLLYTVVPSYARMYDEMMAGDPLPSMTNFTFGLSYTLRRYTFIFLVLWLGLIALMLLAMVENTLGNRLMSRVATCLPGAPQVRRAADLTRLCKLLSLYVRQGLQLDVGLTHIAAMMESNGVRQSVARWQEQVACGMSIAQVLAEEEELDPLLVTAFQHLDEAQLAEALDQLGDVYATRTRMILNRFLDIWMIGSVLLMIVVCGLVILAMFMPMLKLVDAFGSY